MIRARLAAQGCDGDRNNRGGSEQRRPGSVADVGDRRVEHADDVVAPKGDGHPVGTGAQRDPSPRDRFVRDDGRGAREPKG